MHHLNVFECMAVSVLLIAVKLNYAILLLQFDVPIEPSEEHRALQCSLR